MVLGVEMDGYVFLNVNYNFSPLDYCFELWLEVKSSDNLYVDITQCLLCPKSWNVMMIVGSSIGAEVAHFRHLGQKRKLPPLILYG